MSFEQICYDGKVSHNCGSQPLPRTPQSPHKVAGWSRATAGPALTFARAHAGPPAVSAGDEAASRCHCSTAGAVPIALPACPAPSLSVAWCPTSKQSPGLVGAGGGWQCFFSVPCTLQPSAGTWCLCARQAARPAATQLPTAPSPTQPPPAPAVLCPAKVQGPGWAAGESLALIAAPHK